VRRLQPSLHLSLLLALALYLLLIFVSFDQVEEDAFIYYRVAENLADDAGYRFNPGGERIETGSSVAWQFLLAGIALLPVDLVIAGKLLGVAVGLLCLVALYRLARIYVPDARLRWLPLLLLAVDAPFVMGAQRGLETPLALLAFLLYVLCCADRAWHRWLGLACTLLMLARPEGVFVAAALLALANVLLRGRGEIRFGRQWLVFGGCAALLFGLRLVYFHDLFAQPFYAKMGYSGIRQFVPLGPFALRSFLFLPLLALAIGLARRASWRPENAILLACIAMSALWHAVANDYMAYTRHLVPAIALTYLAAVVFIAPLAVRHRRGATAAVLFFVACAGLGVGWSQTTSHYGRVGTNPIRLTLAAFAASPGEHTASVLELFRSDRPALSAHRARLAVASVPRNVPVLPAIERVTTYAVYANYQALIGEFLARSYPEGIAVVYDQMGQTPYYAGSDKSFVDTAGLAERAIGLYLFKALTAQSGSALDRLYLRLRDGLVAALFGEAPLDPARFRGVNHVLSSEPDLVLLNTVSGVPGSLIRAVVNAPVFEEHYALRYRLNGLILVYERRGRFAEREPDAPPDLVVERVDRCLQLPAPPDRFPMLAGVPRCGS
jgi:hypothetical protein